MYLMEGVLVVKAPTKGFPSMKAMINYTDITVIALITIDFSLWTGTGLTDHLIIMC